jgi:hypothetical protein
LSDAAAHLLNAFDRQVGWCRQGASPFSARVLERSRAWLLREPAALHTLAAVSDDPLAAAVTLRWLGALHHLALLGRQPWAGAWPPSRADLSDEELERAIAIAWRDEQAHLRAALAHPPQTNEVQRSAALLPGLLHIAARTGRPLALAEIGSSAGLNLWCDRYRYEAQGDAAAWAWGDSASPLVLRPEWRGPASTLAPTAPLSITRRSGCDAAPLDLLKPGGDLRLASFIWADQAERLARLKAAIAIVRPLLRDGGGAVQSRRAGDFVRRELATRRAGECWVLMHSVVWQYIGRDEQEDIRAQVADAGCAATADAPLAWLRFEPPQPDLRVELRATVWPGGDDQLLASCHPHGAWVEWLGAAGSAPALAVAAAVAPSGP